MSDYDTKPRRVTATQMERLANWSLRKPVIALMGEFSAGKSTLLNLLLGERVLPTQVTATRMPPVWLRFGNEASYRVDRDGMQHPVDIKDPASIPVKDTRYVRVHVQSPILKNMDLMDTPGISDPNIPTDSWIRAIGYANAVLWCTHAGQAWRESERSAWESLPMRLRKTSLLLITRSDKITNDIDRNKIDRRMQRETSHLFDGRHFVSLTNAQRAKDSGDEEAWQSSGAASFMDSLNRIVEGVGIERSYLVSRYTLDDGTATDSYVSAAREAQVEAEAAIEAEAPWAEVDTMDFAETIARAAAEKDPPVERSFPRAVETTLAAEPEEPEIDEIDALEEELVTPEPVDSYMGVADDAPVMEAGDQPAPEAEAPDAPDAEEDLVAISPLRRIRPEGDRLATPRPERANFEDRFAALNRVVGEAPETVEVGPPDSEDDGEYDLNDAFAAGATEAEAQAPEEVLTEIDTPEPSLSEAEPTAFDEIVDDLMREDAVAETVYGIESVSAPDADSDAAVIDTHRAIAAALETERTAELAETAEDPMPSMALASPAPRAPASGTGSIDDLVSILTAAVPAAERLAVAEAGDELPSDLGPELLPEEADNIRETWEDMQARYNIAAMPRLQAVMEALVSTLTVPEVAAEPEAEPEPAAAQDDGSTALTVVSDDDAEEPVQQRRFVRGLF